MFRTPQELKRILNILKMFSLCKLYITDIWTGISDMTYILQTFYERAYSFAHPAHHYVEKNVLVLS